MADAPTIGVIGTAIVTAGGIIGTAVSRSIRWAARQYREQSTQLADVVRDNTRALTDFAHAIGQMAGTVQTVARETSDVYAVPPDTAPADPRTRAEIEQTPRRFPRPQTKPKG